MNEELNDAYIQEVGKQKLLSDAEEQQLAETAQEMGLKRERVRQIRNQAIRKLCKLSKNKNIKSFLLK